MSVAISMGGLRTGLTKGVMLLVTSEIATSLTLLAMTDLGYGIGKHPPGPPRGGIGEVAVSVERYVREGDAGGPVISASLPLLAMTNYGALLRENSGTP